MTKVSILAVSETFAVPCYCTTESAISSASNVGVVRSHRDRNKLSKRVQDMQGHINPTFSLNSYYCLVFSTIYIILF